MGPAGIGPSIRQDSLQVPGSAVTASPLALTHPRSPREQAQRTGEGAAAPSLRLAEHSPTRPGSKFDSRTVAAPAPRPARRPLSHPGQREGADSEARGTRHHCRSATVTVTGMPSVAPHVSARNYAEAWGRPGPH
jgi:hypothetical protein